MSEKKLILDLNDPDFPAMISAVISNSIGQKIDHIVNIESLVTADPPVVVAKFPVTVNLGTRTYVHVFDLVDYNMKDLFNEITAEVNGLRKSLDIWIKIQGALL